MQAVNTVSNRLDKKQLKTFDDYVRELSAAYVAYGRIRAFDESFGMNVDELDEALNGVQALIEEWAALDETRQLVGDRDVPWRDLA